jgi:hypothetical protein
LKTVRFRLLFIGSSVAKPSSLQALYFALLYSSSLTGFSQIVFPF